MTAINYKILSCITIVFCLCMMSCEDDYLNNYFTETDRYSFSLGDYNNQVESYGTTMRITTSASANANAIEWQISDYPSEIVPVSTTGHAGETIVFEVVPNRTAEKKTFSFNVTAKAGTKWIVKKTITIYQKEQAHTYNGYEYVNLGLPSGLRWASCNVGASSPEEQGYLYAWGEIKTKSTYSDLNYRFYYSGKLSKYTCQASASFRGTADNKTLLELEDDVANVEWGGRWRMPTYEDVKELIDNCTFSITTVNSVQVQKITGPNGESMYIPIDPTENEPIIWTCSLCTDDSYNSTRAYIMYGKITDKVKLRSEPATVRPVFIP